MSSCHKRTLLVALCFSLLAFSLANSKTFADPPESDTCQQFMRILEKYGDKVALITYVLPKWIEDMDQKLALCFLSGELGHCRLGPDTPEGLLFQQV